MTNAVFQRKNGRFCGFTISGHAGQAASDRNSIVCAAVSSAVQLATILITESFQEQDEESADGDTITVRLGSPENGNASRVLDGLYQHLEFLSEDYPGTITIHITEV
ncbi:MAG: ribosomal-processing cysteine protease Prp [Oscillospiraceae bacterium]|nr:ribosomal-processing cysteine protease Prp [Oscillospiraceae bacterium]